MRWRETGLCPPLLSFRLITGHLSQPRHRHSSLWLKGSHSNREPRGLVQGGESFLKVLTLSPSVLLFEPLTPGQDIFSFCEADTFHPPPSGETHPGGNLPYSVASFYGNILDEASFRAALPAIEGQHVASPIQIHSRATWIGTI